jgi:hypothetical protein
VSGVEGEYHGGSGSLTTGGRLEWKLEAIDDS